MARITVEDCLDQEPNRFALVQLASKRSKQLLTGARPTSTDVRHNKAVVMALREIAEGKVRFMSAEEEEIEAQREQEEAISVSKDRNGESSLPSPDDLFFKAPAKLADEDSEDIVDDLEEGLSEDADDDSSMENIDDEAEEVEEEKSSGIGDDVVEDDSVDK